MKKVLLTTVMLSAINMAYGEKLQKVVVSGNKRIESVTIESLLGVKVGEEISNSTADMILQNLYNTGYFTNVNVQKNAGTLNIVVSENPTIYEVAYEGNNKLTTEQIDAEIKLQPRKILSKTDIQNAQQRLLEMYRRMGRFSAKVDPKIIKLDNNRVSLVFEIEEGESTHIQNIFFLGNKKYSTGRLEETLMSKRYKFWRFFANDDVYDPDRFMADQQALRQFYANHGYPDFRIINAIAELTPDKKEYYLTFSIDEGEQYKFVKPQIVSAVKDVPADTLEKNIVFSDGDIYSAKEIEKSVTEITDALGSKGYAFVAVEPIIVRNNTQKTAHVTFEIKEGPRVYVEKITIKGNNRTHDAVIRRELTLHEGDAYNASKIRDSETNIKDLGYFKESSVESEPGTNPDQAKLLVKVEEQRTGELKFGGGFSTTDGLMANVGISERNFMGKGQIVHAELGVSKRHQDINLGITEPYLFDRPLAGSVDVYSIRSSRIDSYVTKSTGFNLGLGYHLTPNLTQRFAYSLHKDSVSQIATDASPFIQADPKNSLSSSIAHTLTYDKRDSTQDPTRGYTISMTNAYTGVGGNVYNMKNDLSATVFYTPVENITTLFRLGTGRVDKVGSKRVRIVDAVYLGADSFRGFEYAGLGPRDNRGRKDALGGRKYWKGTVEVQFPVGLPVDFGVKAAVFTDFGTVWDSPAKGVNVLDDKKMRASLGVGIIWKGPFGPLRIDYAIPFKKSKFDEEQRINLGYALPL